MSRNFYVRTHVNFTGVNKVETIERVPFTANVKLKLRIS